MNIEEVTSSTIHSVYQFLDAQNEISSHFRYFHTRNPTDVIENHILTIIGREASTGKAMAYGHIDRQPQTNQNWLGICVYNSYQGKGFGSQCMKYLLSHADSHRLHLMLSVDIDNLHAFQMYRKFGFVEVSRTLHVVYMERTPKSV